MPEKPKKSPADEQARDEKPDVPTWESDQKRRGYYYDDAHGYEKYEPEDEEIDED